MKNTNHKNCIAVARRLVHMPGFVLVGTAYAVPRPDRDVDPVTEQAPRPDSCT